VNFAIPDFARRRPPGFRRPGAQRSYVFFTSGDVAALRRRINRSGTIVTPQSSLMKAPSDNISTL